MIYSASVAPSSGPVSWRPTNEQVDGLAMSAVAEQQICESIDRYRLMTAYLLTKVITQTNMLIPSYDSAIQSAELAVRKGRGSCIATTKVVAGFLAASGLDSYVFL